MNVNIKIKEGTAKGQMWFEPTGMVKHGRSIRLPSSILESEMKPTKDYDYSFFHVKERLYERFNLDIDLKFYDLMNKNIKPFIGNPDCGTDNNGEQEIHSMFIKNQIIKVVYSISNDRITTVLK